MLKRTSLWIAILSLGVILVILVSRLPFGNKSPIVLDSSKPINIYLLPDSNDSSLIHININSSVEDSISAIAVRLTLEDKGDIEPADIVILPDKTLSNSGWTYLIKNVKEDFRPKRIVLELALVSLGPEGLKLKGEAVLADIKIPVSSSLNIKDFKFDPQETKVISKDSRELPLGLGNLQ